MAASNRHARRRCAHGVKGSRHGPKSARRTASRSHKKGSGRAISRHRHRAWLRGVRFYVVRRCPDLRSFLRVQANASTEKFAREPSASLLGRCTISTTKRLRHSGNTKGLLVEADPVVLMMRSSSKRLALLDRVTEGLRVAWCLPGCGSARPGGGDSRACDGLSTCQRLTRIQNSLGRARFGLGLIEVSCSGRSPSTR